MRTSCHLGEWPKGSCHPNQAAHAKRLLSHHLAERYSKALRSADEPAAHLDDRTGRGSSGPDDQREEVPPVH